MNDLDKTVETKEGETKNSQWGKRRKRIKTGK